MFFDLNSTYPKYYSPPHILPKIILSITTLIGIFSILSFKMNLPNYFSLFYIANIGLFSVFFILPRYSLSLLTIQIILSLFGVEKIFKKIKMWHEKNYKYLTKQSSYIFLYNSFFDFNFFDYYFISKPRLIELNPKLLGK